MDKEIINRLDRIIELFVEANRPRNRIISFLEIFSAIVGALGIIGIINDFFGG